MQSAGETPMTPQPDFDAAYCDEIAKRIRKLRWIGCDAEADLLAKSVAHMPNFLPIVAALRDTD